MKKWQHALMFFVMSGVLVSIIYIALINAGKPKAEERKRYSNLVKVLISDEELRRLELDE
jgi:hypothetical protein